MYLNFNENNVRYILHYILPIFIIGKGEFLNQDEELMLGACHRSPVSIANGYVPYKIGITKRKPSSSDSTTEVSAEIHQSTWGNEVLCAKVFSLDENTCMACKQIKTVDLNPNLSGYVSVPEEKIIDKNHIHANIKRKENYDVRYDGHRNSLCSRCTKIFKQYRAQDYYIDPCPKKALLGHEHILDPYFEQIVHNNCFKAGLLHQKSEGQPQLEQGKDAMMGNTSIKFGANTNPPLWDNGDDNANQLEASSANASPPSGQLPSNNKLSAILSIMVYSQQLISGIYIL